MRYDMKRVIINHPRSNSFATYIRKKYNLKELENLPERTGMSNSYYGYSMMDKEEHDRISPLIRFLKGCVDRNWSDVWNEICQQCDSRRIDGWHLRSHIQDLITWSDNVSHMKRASYESWLCVDDDGIIRTVPGIKRKPHLLGRLNHRRPKKNHWDRQILRHGPILNILREEEVRKLLA